MYKIVAKNNAGIVETSANLELGNNINLLLKNF